MRRERSVATQRLAAHRMLSVSVDCSSSLGQTIGSRWPFRHLVRVLFTGSTSMPGLQNTSWFAMHMLATGIPIFISDKVVSILWRT